MMQTTLQKHRRALIFAGLLSQQFGKDAFSVALLLSVAVGTLLACAPGGRSNITGFATCPRSRATASKSI